MDAHAGTESRPQLHSEGVADERMYLSGLCCSCWLLVNRVVWRACRLHVGRARFVSKRGKYGNGKALPLFDETDPPNSSPSLTV